jgi:hypothetical protein
MMMVLVKLEMSKDKFEIEQLELNKIVLEWTKNIGIDLNKIENRS